VSREYRLLTDGQTVRWTDRQQQQHSPGYPAMHTRRAVKSAIKGNNVVHKR